MCDNVAILIKDNVVASNYSFTKRLCFQSTSSSVFCIVESQITEVEHGGERNDFGPVSSFHVLFSFSKALKITVHYFASPKFQNK